MGMRNPNPSCNHEAKSIKDLKITKREKKMFALTLFYVKNTKQKQKHGAWGSIHIKWRYVPQDSLNTKTLKTLEIHNALISSELIEQIHSNPSYGLMKCNRMKSKP